MADPSKQPQYQPTDPVINLNFGRPTIFYDSHPEQQPSWLGGYIQTFTSHLKIAWTGDVPKPLFPGTIRLVWWTTDGARGLRDYELHEHDLVHSQYILLQTLPEVSRCLITGYSGQNPYVLTYGGANPFLEVEAKRMQGKKGWKSPEELARVRGKREEDLRRRLREEGMRARGEIKDEEGETKEGEGEGEGAKKRGGGVMRYIDQVITKAEDEEKEGLLQGAEHDGEMA